MDFLKAPTATQLELAKTRASQQLARPSDLFAVPLNPPPVKPLPQPEPTPPPTRPAAPPKIEFGDLTEEPAIDNWSELAEMPAASFIDLASRLEADARMSWARVAWERVIDRCAADADELQAAIKGVLRTRVAPDPDTTRDAAPLTLRVSAPSDRVEITRRAMNSAAEALSSASSGLVNFSGEVTSTSELEAELEVSIGAKDIFSAIRIPAPEAPTDYTEALLSASFRLIGSQLATNAQLQPISNPLPGETAVDSLATRITRLAWRSFAAAHETP